MRERRDENPIFISGVRKKESVRRGQRVAYKQPIDVDGDSKTAFVKPFFYKNGNELWRYVTDNNIEISPVHAILNTSGDCLCGCFADPKWELQLIQQFYPYMFNSIKWLEKRIQTHGTPKAKRFATWGSGPSVHDIEVQQMIDDYFNPEEYCTESCQVVI